MNTTRLDISKLVTKSAADIDRYADGQNTENNLALTAGSFANLKIPQEAMTSDEFATAAS